MGKKRSWKSKGLPCVFSIRVTEDEHKEIFERAQSFNLSASRFLVQCGLNRELPPGRKIGAINEETRDELIRLMAELHHVGTNLNQLARGYNLARLTGTEGPGPSEVAVATAAAKELIEEIKSRL